MKSPNADVLALVRDLHVGALRFPGGTRAMRYRFEEAIGPYAQRKPQCDAFTGATDATTYGLAEFLALAAELAAEVTLVAPWVDGSPQRTAAMIAYANGDPASAVKLGIDGEGTDWGTSGDWAAKRVADGHAAAWGVSIVEIGNEPYLDLAVGPAVSCGRASQFHQDERWVAGKAIPTTAADYAAQLVATAALVRAIDPKIQIAAPAYSSFDGASDAAREAGDVDRKAGGDAWGARLVSDASGAFDLFVLHPYDLGFSDSRVRLGARLEKTIRDLKAIAPTKGIAITEYGFLGGGDTLMNVVASADIVRVGIETGASMVLRHVLIEDDPNEPFANAAALLGTAHAKKPGYAVMRLLATTLSGVAVPTPEILPDVEAMAVKTSRGVAILLLDRRVDATGATTVAIALPPGSFKGTVHMLQADALRSTDVTQADTPVSVSGFVRVELAVNAVAVVVLER